MHSQDEAEGCSNANKNHNNVHGDTDKARVIDIEVFDISALVGQEETEDNQQSFVNIQCSDEIAVVSTVTLFISLLNIIGIVLQ